MLLQLITELGVDYVFYKLFCSLKQPSKIAIQLIP